MLEITRSLVYTVARLPTTKVIGGPSAGSTFGIDVIVEVSSAPS